MMDALLQVAAAVIAIAIMMGMRVVSSRALFRFRMNNGFRAHECDGTCGHHGSEATNRARKSQ